MGNDERTAFGGRTNWPIVLSGWVGGCVGLGLFLLSIYLAGVDGLWLRMIGAGVGAGLGAVLGKTAGARVFRRPPS